MGGRANRRAELQAVAADSGGRRGGGAGRHGAVRGGGEAGGREWDCGGAEEAAGEAGGELEGADPEQCVEVDSVGRYYYYYYYYYISGVYIICTLPSLSRPPRSLVLYSEGWIDM